MLRHLMLLEDNELERKWLEQYLSSRYSRSLQVRTVATLEEAQANLVDKGGVDIIVADMLLPDSADPFLTCTKLSQIAPGVPIIVTTGLEAGGSWEFDVTACDSVIGIVHKEDLKREPALIVPLLTKAVQRLVGADTVSVTVDRRITALHGLIQSAEDKIEAYIRQHSTSDSALAQQINSNEDKLDELLAILKGQIMPDGSINIGAMQRIVSLEDKWKRVHRAIMLLSGFLGAIATGVAINWFSR